MSRTYRNPHRMTSQSDEAYINEVIVEWNIDRVKRVKRYRSREEIEQLSIEAEADCKERIRENGDSPYLFEKIGAGFTRTTVITPNYPHHYEMVTVPVSLEETIEEAKEYCRSLSRDGKWNETSHNKLFKHLCKKETRAAARKVVHKAMRDEEYEHIGLDQKIGKKFFWSVW